MGERAGLGFPSPGPWIGLPAAGKKLTFGLGPV